MIKVKHSYTAQLYINIYIYIYYSENAQNFINKYQNQSSFLLLSSELCTTNVNPSYMNILFAAQIVRFIFVIRE